MDSSLIVAIMSRVMAEKVSTFSIGVAEQDFNELPFAREVALHCKTSHYEEVVSPDLVRLLPKIIYHLDEPSDPIAACMYHAAELAARHVKVVLSGDGGDELFAGYDRYLGFRWARVYAALPHPIRRFLLGPFLNVLPDNGAYKNLTQKARWLHNLSFYEGGRRYAEATVFFRFGGSGRQGLYTPHVANQLTDRDPTLCVVQAFEEADAGDDLDRMLYADLVTRLPEHSMMLTDRMTMSQGLEGRSPFLDHHLAEFVATLPASLKMRGNRLKYLMREVARGYLPERILNRPKQGFMFPLAYWMKGRLLPLLRDLPQTSSLVRNGIFRKEAITQLVAEHVANRADHHVRLWMILNAELWYRMYLLGESIQDLSDLLAEKADAALRAKAVPCGI
jgi:asparagine synthase (glutamine-hydrolysing)